jgi:hypothetical protein
MRRFAFVFSCLRFGKREQDGSQRLDHGPSLRFRRDVGLGGAAPESINAICSHRGVIGPPATTLPARKKPAGRSPAERAHRRAGGTRRFTYFEVA